MYFPNRNAPITLYESKLSDFDLLDRSQLSRDLSELLERIDEPLVVALDGNWGTGKSFFLKCWVGDHALANSGTARTIYFDAFESDYFREPLVALTEAIADRFNDKKDKGRVEKLRSAAQRLWRPAARIALAVATTGATEVAGAVADAGIEAFSKEIEAEVEKVWQSEIGRQQSVLSFKSALSELTYANGGQKILFVIDELDRCRPDFALEIIEISKHFFNIPNVHFVLGANWSALEASVTSKYGDKIDARGYLSKFISIKMNMPERVITRGATSFSALKYLDAKSKELNVPSAIHEELRFYFRSKVMVSRLTLRGVDRLLSEISLLPNGDNVLTRLYPGYRMALVGLCILKSGEIELFDRLKEGRAEFSELIDYFDFDPNADEHRSVVLNLCWCVFQNRKIKKEPASSGFFDPFGIRDGREALDGLIKDYIEKFEFPQP